MQIGLYEDPAVYDILHARGTAREVRGLFRIARRFIGPGKQTWLESACGTGRYLRAAARLGIRGIGFDLSPGMIEYARRPGTGQPRPGNPRFFVGDMTDFAARVRPASVHLAFNVINTIRHLESDKALLAHLREVRRTLRPRAVYVVGITLTSYGMEFPSEDVWHGARGRCRVKQVVQYVPPIGTKQERGRQEMVHSHLVVTRGRRVEHRDSSYPLRCYSESQWLEAVHRAGLRARGLVDDDGRDIVASPSGYGLWVLGG
ncbi:MAG: class I SAM-dependent methyltransferase [Phycisphaerales bacterium]|nr:class I SAM-dependent methyltransferase [Phycisphaerales bacterium]